jgi:hypothetical protein
MVLAMAIADNHRSLFLFSVAKAISGFFTRSLSNVAIRCNNVKPTSVSTD